MRAFINELVGTRHHIEHFFVHDNVRTEKVHQRKQIIVAGLQRCCSQHDYRVCVLAEIADALVRECFFFFQTAVADMVCLIDNDKIKVWRRIQIQKAVLLAVPMFFAFVYAAVQYGIRNDGFVIAHRPFLVPMRIGNGLTEDRAVQRNEILVKTFHFQFPLAFCHKRFRADDQNIVELVSCFEFLDDQSGFDCFTDADAVRDQDLRLVGFDKFQCRTELIRNEIDPCRVQ